MRILTLLVSLAVIPALNAQKLSEDELIYGEWVCLNSSRITDGFLTDSILLMDETKVEGQGMAQLWNFVFEEEESFKAYKVDLSSAASRLVVPLSDSLFEAMDADSMLVNAEAGYVLSDFSWVTGRKCIRFERFSDPLDVIIVQRSGESWKKLGDRAWGIYVEYLETNYTDWKLDRRKQHLILHYHNSPDNALIYRINRISDTEILLILESITLR